MTTNGNPTPPLTLQDFRASGHQLAQARRQAIEDRLSIAEEAAKAKGELEKVKAVTWVRLKNQGLSAAQVDGTVKGEAEVVLAQLRADTAQAKLRAADSKLDGIDGERATLHRIADWSMKLGDLVAS